MKKIMVDMDDVICDGGFLKIINEFLGTNYNNDSTTTFYRQDLIPKERQKEWEKFFCTKNIYDEAEFLPNAYETMKKLSKYYELYIGTGYIFRGNEYYSGINLKNKYNWLKENISFIPPENYLFITNKELINCEIKIDDMLHNLKGNTETKLLFTAYHNKNLTEEKIKEVGAIRVNGWKEIENRLLK